MSDKLIRITRDGGAACHRKNGCIIGAGEGEGGMGKCNEPPKSFGNRSP